MIGPGLGHKGEVHGQELGRAALLAAAVATSGCGGFGGPLLAETDEGESDSSDGGTDTQPDESPCGPTSAVVDRVIDGDTIVLETGEHVRYILVDTPEITDGKDECWGEEASIYNQMLVFGRTVELEYDVDCEDQYGRLLAYVSVGEVEVNRALLEHGFACVLHIPPNGDDRWPEYQALETAAKQGGVGMWGACTPVPCD